MILGGGPIGCEMAQAWARLGVDITLVEGLDRVLPHEEPDASEVVARALTADGVRVLTGSPVDRACRSPDGDVSLVLGDGRRVRAEEILVSLGRTPSSATSPVARSSRTPPVGWDGMGRSVQRFVEARPDPELPIRLHCGAVGDVHRVGLTEADAAARYPSARVAHLDLEHVDRAITAGATDGFVKLIAAPRPGLGHLAGGRLVARRWSHPREAN